jgi:hypothetical protein
MRERVRARGADPKRFHHDPKNISTIQEYTNYIEFIVHTDTTQTQHRHHKDTTQTPHRHHCQYWGWGKRESTKMKHKEAEMQNYDEKTCGAEDVCV